MTDDWGIDSQTLDLHLRFAMGEGRYLQPHLRYYTQSAADFYRTVLFDGGAAARVRVGGLPAGRLRRRDARLQVRLARQARRLERCAPSSTSRPDRRAPARTSACCATSISTPT